MSFAPTSITMADAADVLPKGMEAVVQGATTIDLSGLTHFDSSAVSTLLAWQPILILRSKGSFGIMWRGSLK